jgi:hypothetical protein
MSRVFFRSFSSDVHVHHSFGTQGLQYGNGGDIFRFAFGLESFFCLPEEGMTQFEILSRGSCFLTPDGPRLRVVAPAHVSHPWKFRSRFGALAKPELDWLDAVREDAVRVVLSAREIGTGRMLAKVPLENGVVHPDLDLALFDICDEFENVRQLEASGISVIPVELGEDTAKPDSPVVLVGHELKSEESLLPCWLNGQLVGGESGVAAIKTFGDASQMGLCGGPVLVQANNEQVRSLGMVFARVDAEGPLFNHTLIVTSQAIKAFLKV